MGSRLRGHWVRALESPGSFLAFLRISLFSKTVEFEGPLQLQYRELIEILRPIQV